MGWGWASCALAHPSGDNVQGHLIVFPLAGLGGVPLNRYIARC